MAIQLRDLVLSEPGRSEPDTERRGVPAGPYLLPPAVVVEPATPTDVLLGALPSPDLRIRKPIRLEVKREGDSVAVWSADLEELGYGLHLTEAIEDFQQTVIELYHALEAEQDRLGPGMIELWDALQQLLERRP